MAARRSDPVRGAWGRVAAPLRALGGRLRHGERPAQGPDPSALLEPVRALWTDDPSRAAAGTDRVVETLARGRTGAELADLLIGALPGQPARADLRCVLHLREGPQPGARVAGHLSLARHAARQCQDFRRAAAELEACLAIPEALTPATRDTVLAELTHARLRMGDRSEALALNAARQAAGADLRVQRARLLLPDDPDAAIGILDEIAGETATIGREAAALLLAGLWSRNDLDGVEALARRIEGMPGCADLARGHLTNLSLARGGPAEGLRATLDTLGVTADRVGDFDAIALAPRGPAAANDTLVTIVMTAFEAEAHVATAIGSILAQTWDNLELVVVDDCSGDGTLARIEALAAEDPRLRPLRTARNGGTYLAKNLGIAAARGSHVALCDADDMWTPDHLAAHMAAMAARPGAMVSSSNWLRVFQNGGVEIAPHGAIVERCPHSTLFRREVFDRVGFFDSVRIGADREFLRRVTLDCGSGVHVDRVLTLGRRHGASLTMTGDGAIAQGRTPGIRQVYRHTWTCWQIDRIRAGAPLYNSGRPGDRPYDVPDGMV